MIFPSEAVGCWCFRVCLHPVLRFRKWYGVIIELSVEIDVHRRLQINSNQTTTQTLMAGPLKLSCLITYSSLTSLVVFSCRRWTPVRRSHNYPPRPVLPPHENRPETWNSIVVGFSNLSVGRITISRKWVSEMLQTKCDLANVVTGLGHFVEYRGANQWHSKLFRYLGVYVKSDCVYVKSDCVYVKSEPRRVAL